MSIQHVHADKKQADKHQSLTVNGL